MINMETTPPRGATIYVPGEETQEILSTEPAWMVRWGSTLFLLLIVLLLVLSYLLHYPDIVKAPFTLTSHNAPTMVETKADGKLIGLRAGEGQWVAKGEALAFLQSTARHQDVLALHAWLERVSGLLLTGTPEKLLTLEKPYFGRLGEVQAGYQAFDRAYVQYQAFLSGRFYHTQRKLLQQDLTHLRLQQQNLADRQRLFQKNLKLAQEEFAAQQQLALEKVIASLDLKRLESRLVDREIAVKEVEAALVENLSRQADKHKELLELDKVIADQNGIFLQALNTFRSRLDDWDQQYVLRSPVDGRVNFFTFVQENQALRAGQEIFSVHAAGGEAFGEVKIAQYNLGKVKRGQAVLIKFDSYPFQEFGAVKGRVDFIAQVPGSDNAYLARVALPEGLTTSYGRKLTYKSGMTATAEIITEDARLMEKIFLRFKKALAR